VRLQFVVYRLLLQTLHLFLISTLNQLSTRGIFPLTDEPILGIVLLSIIATAVLLVNKLIITRENG
jgi:hypothetical protein